MTVTKLRGDDTYEPGHLYHVPPGDLLLERNIREATPSADLIASVENVGVLEPVTCVLNDAGNLVVRYGHRRVMAAMAACVTPIPVYVTAVDNLDDAAEVDRIIAQRDENTHRIGLSAADEVGIVEQLSAFGLTAAQIAQQARVKKEKVATALTVSGSAMAKKAVVEYDELTLDQIAAVVEFEDDTEAVEELLATAVEDPWDFTHAVQRKRDDRERAKVKAAATAELTAAGVTVVDQPSWDSKVKRLDGLVDAKGKQLTPANHKDCPGHVAWVTTHSGTEYGCATPAKQGHKDRYSSGSSSKPAAADMTDEQREKAKAERRLVIDNNKAWDSAQTVRRDYLATFAKLKTPPKGTAAFIARAIGLDAGILQSHGSDKHAATWLGTKEGSYGTSPVADLANGATEGRALQVLLVMVLSAYEENTDRMDWRRDGETSTTGRYLRFLDEAGYGLSDVEKYAISSKTA